MRIVAIDPGTTQSAFVVFDGEVIEAGILLNEDLRERLLLNHFGSADVCAIEMVESYGMAVGREVFQTCVWIGRFHECSRVPVRYVPRKEIKLHLCGTHRAKDANIRQALIDKYGAPGTKKAPGKTFGITSHLWAALAIADYIAETAPVEA
jgi:hypothetical protein